jgi:hypothetical protein
MKKNQKEKAADVDDYFWFKWQKLRRHPDYIKDYDWLIRVQAYQVVLKSNSENNPDNNNDWLDYKVRQHKIKPISNFLSISNRISELYLDNAHEDEFLLEDAVSKLIPKIKKCFPAFNHFRKKWQIAFPIDPRIEIPSIYFLRYPANEPVLLWPIDKVSDTESILDFKIRVIYWKTELALSYIKGYLEQNIPRNYKSSPRKTDGNNAILKNYLRYNAKTNQGIFYFKARLLHTIRRDKITGTNTAQVLDQIREILMAHKGEKRESLNKDKRYYEILFRVWDMRKQGKPFSAIAVPPRYTEDAAKKQFLRVSELILGRKTPPEQLKQARKLQKNEMIYFCPTCPERPTCTRKTPCPEMEALLKQDEPSQRELTIGEPIQ